MADQEDEIDVEIRSVVSQLRELHDEFDDEILKLMKVVEESSRTNVERETVGVSIDMLIEGREELRKLLEDHAVYVNSRNKNNSLDMMKKSRMVFLKESAQKFRNLYHGIQERQSDDHFSVQGEGEERNSSGYVADGETEPKDPIFSFDDSDSSSEFEIEVWNEKNFDPDMKRRFLEKAMGSCDETEEEIEIETEEFIDNSDDNGFSTNIEKLWEQRDLFIAESSSSSEGCNDGGNDAYVERSPDDGHVSIGIEGLVEDLKIQDEDESGSL